MITETEQKAVLGCVLKMRELAESHPAWWADYEDAQMEIGCDRIVLETLLRTAPNDFAKGVIFGKIVFRQQVAALTERPF